MSVEDKTKDLLATLDQRINVLPRSMPKDTKISSIVHVPWEVPFSPFNPQHMKAASQLMKILMAAKDFQEYMDILDEVREYENDGLFLYALYSSVRHREDTKGVVLPPIEERAPHWFFAAETIHQAIQLSIHQPNADHTVTNQRTANVNDIEGQLQYFREDIGMNRHHWAWHVVYPSIWDEATMGKPKDRKGELFYYMHSQMLARYDTERLSNWMNRVEPLVNFEDDLDPYFPHLTSQTTGVHFSARPPSMRINNISGVSLQDLEVWRFRILDAIDQGYLRDASGRRVSLANEKAIDVLGAVVEASSDSINQDYYGNLHNQGHNLLSQCHDPEARFNKHPGVMGSTESAARDPIFYRWHKYMDEIFTRHKNKLAPYTKEELSFQGIKVLSAEIQGAKANSVQTFKREGRSDLSHAPFLKTNGKILVRYEHLDHEQYKLNFRILNNTSFIKDVIIRVFIAPKFNVNGVEFTPNEQRRLMIELDKIQTRLQRGMNTITRMDSQSSVTMSRQIRSYSSLKGGNYSAQLDYCSCGWPEHLALPRGRTEGMDFTLFVMVTDYNKDKTTGENDDEMGSISYCGSRDDKYPDSKPMGFPFDRRIEENSMERFLTDNMHLADVKITFSNEVRPITDWVLNNYVNRT